MNTKGKPSAIQNKTMTCHNYSKTLLKKFNDLRVTKTYCDYTLKTGDEHFDVHKLVLCIVSEYFQASLTSDMKENQSSSTTFDSLDVVGLKAVVDFMYSGKVTLNKENVYSAVHAASHLKIKQMLDSWIITVTRDYEFTDIVKSKKLKSRGYSQTLLNTFNDLRLAKTYCDYTLIAGDEQFDVHKLILCSVSEYFRATFTSAMKESLSNSTTFDSVDVVGLRAVVDFLYSGTVTLNKENMYPIVYAASYLQIEEMLNLCISFISSRVLSADNCVEIWKYGEMYSLKRLCRMVHNFLVEHLTQVPKDQYNMLTVTQLTGILSESALEVTSELQLVVIVKDWMEANKDVDLSIVQDINPEEEVWVTFGQLFCKIRWPMISTKDMEENVSIGIKSAMNQIENCKVLLDEATVYHSDIHKQPLIQTVNTTFRLHYNYEDLIICNSNRCKTISYDVCCRGSGDLKTSIETSQPVIKNPDRTPYTAEYIDPITCIATVNDFMYVCGGLVLVEKTVQVSPRCFRYDPRFDKWLELQSMGVPRARFVLVAHNNKLYALGGFKGMSATTFTCECYDIATNQWSFIRQTPTIMRNHAGCVAKDSIYISGGGDTERGEKCQEEVCEDNCNERETNNNEDVDEDVEENDEDEVVEKVKQDDCEVKFTDNETSVKIEDDREVKHDENPDNDDVKNDEKVEIFDSEAQSNESNRATGNCEDIVMDYKDDHNVEANEIGNEQVNVDNEVPDVDDADSDDNYGDDYDDSDGDYNEVVILHRDTEMFRYNVDTNTWNECASMSYGRRYHVMAYYRDNVYVLCGRTYDSDDVSKVERYSPETDQWTTLEKEIKMCIGWCYVKHDAIYLVGSTNNSGDSHVRSFTNQLEKDYFASMFTDDDEDHFKECQKITKCCCLSYANVQGDCAQLRMPCVPKDLRQAKKEREQEENERHAWYSDDSFDFGHTRKENCVCM